MNLSTGMASVDGGGQWLYDVPLVNLTGQQLTNRTAAACMVDGGNQLIIVHLAFLLEDLAQPSSRAKSQTPKNP